MCKNFDLSIIIPSINPDKWISIYNQLTISVGKYTFELIVVGPNFPSGELQTFENFRYIREFSCPSRSFQLGALVSLGRYIAFIPDDIVLDEKGMEQCLDFLSDKPKNHGIALRYDEGGQGQSNNLDYWRSKYHGGHKDLEGIEENWKIAPCFLYNREYFVEIGGLDCSFEHVNVNGHGLAHTTQARGGEIHLSPSRVFSAGWTPPTDATILYQAYLQNDEPKFRTLWGRKDAADQYKVEFDNWKNQPAYWPRKYSS